MQKVFNFVGELLVLLAKVTGTIVKGLWKGGIVGKIILFVIVIGLCGALAPRGSSSPASTAEATRAPAVAKVAEIPAATQTPRPPTSTPAPTVTAGPSPTLAPTDTPAPTLTPAPTDTPAPTNTPKPTSTPLSQRDARATAVKATATAKAAAATAVVRAAELRDASMEAAARKQCGERFESFNPGDGILVVCQMADNLLMSWIIGGAMDDFIAISKASFATKPDLRFVTVQLVGPFKDEYGNVKVRPALTLKMTKELYTKINWSAATTFSVARLLHAGRDGGTAGVAPGMRSAWLDYVQ